MYVQPLENGQDDVLFVCPFALETLISFVGEAAIMNFENKVCLYLCGLYIVVCFIVWK